MFELPAKPRFRVFLNYPFDDGFSAFSSAMHFAVTAANLIPVCAKDIGTPDRLRLQAIVDLVANCDFSAHDLSRSKPDNHSGLIRMNMPFEAGMALYRSMSSNSQAHRFALLVTDNHAYKAFVSDLSGLDALPYVDDVSLVTAMYEWLTKVGPTPITSTAPSGHIADLYGHFKDTVPALRRSGAKGQLSHAEMQELIRRICDAGKLWNWRTGPLAEEFPFIPLLFQQSSRYRSKRDRTFRAKGKPTRP
jgi:hypothetical protein